MTDGTGPTEWEIQKLTGHRLQRPGHEFIVKAISFYFDLSFQYGLK